MTRRMFHSTSDSDELQGKNPKILEEIQKMPINKKNPWIQLANNEIKSNKENIHDLSQYLCMYMATAQLINWFFIRLWTQKTLQRFFPSMHTRIWHCSLPKYFAWYFFFFLQQNIIYARATLVQSRAIVKQKAGTKMADCFFLPPLPFIDNSRLMRILRLILKKILLLATRKTFYIPWDLRRYNDTAKSDIVKRSECNKVGKLFLEGTSLFVTENLNFKCWSVFRKFKRRLNKVTRNKTTHRNFFPFLDQKRKHLL